MAHAIEQNIETGLYEMAYVGDTPWWGAGQKLEPGATKQEWLTAAQMNWKIEKRDLAFMLPGETGEMVSPLAGFKAITRNDTDKVFAIASDDYNPVQNEQVVDFFQHYCDAGHATLETLGAIGGGRIVWGLARLNEVETRKILGQDAVEAFIMLANGNDRSIGLVARATQVRVVCQNTLQMAMRDENGKQTTFKMSHLREFTKEVAEEARRTVGMAIAAIERSNDLAEKLAEVTIDEKGWLEFMGKLMGAENVQDDKTKILKPTAAEIYQVTHAAPGSQYAPDTLWQAVNGITYYVDHIKGRGFDTRLKSAMFGDGNRMKQDAMEVAAEMAGVEV